MSKQNVLRKNKGYSLIVLVIAVIVIIILAGVAVTSLRTSRQRTEIQNFIFDLNAMEEKVQSYYVQNGSLPTANKETIDIENLPVDYPAVFKSQLSTYDNENYYYIDTARLGGVALREANRGIDPSNSGYIINEGSLKVYVTKGIEYQIEGNNTSDVYYTLTQNLVNGQELYTPQEEEIKIVGNPLTWTSEAKIRVVLPRQSLSESEWDTWKFKWSFGPKSVEEMRILPTKNDFDYGDNLVCKSNGIYSIYCKEPGTNGKEIVLNVNVTKIDNIPPTFVFQDGGNKITFVDDETGLRSIRYKTLTTYLNNVEDAKTIETENLGARTRNDYFLMNGSGDNLMIQLGSQIIEYATTRKSINNLIQQENTAWQIIQDEYDSAVADEYARQQYLIKRQQHNDIISSYNLQLLDLANKYPYIADINGTTNDSKLVVYAEDYAGNATTVGVNNTELITTKILCDSYNISLDPLN